MTDHKSALLAFLRDDVTEFKAQWVATLATLWQAAHTVACSTCDGSGIQGLDWGRARPCPRCRANGPGPGQFPDPLALLRLCVGVAWRCWSQLSANPKETHCNVLRISSAIKAAEAYLVNPCDETQEAWGEAWAEATGPGLRELPAWLPAPGYPPAIHITAACEAIGVDAVRRVALGDLCLTI